MNTHLAGAAVSDSAAKTPEDKTPLTLADVAGRVTISVPEAGRLLGIGRNAAYDAAESGDLPVLRIGRRILVPVAQLRRLLGEDAPA